MNETAIEVRKPTVERAERERAKQASTGRFLSGYAFTEKKKHEFLGLIENGTGIMQACKAVGVSYKSFHYQREVDPEFADAFWESTRSRDDAVENALYQSALGGNVGAIAMWLFNRQPDRWRDKRQIQADIQAEVRQVDGLEERLRELAHKLTDDG